MNYRKVNDKIFVSLQTGDLINESMRQIAVEENILNAWINGIGAIDNVEVGYMDVKNKKYQKRNFDEDYELLYMYYRKLRESNEYKLLELLYKSLPQHLKEYIRNKIKIQKHMNDSEPLKLLKN